MHVKVDYDPNPGQAAFHESSAPYKGMVGAFGSGKSSTLCMEGLMLSMENPGNVGLIARRTLPELKMTTLKRFFEYLPDPMILSWNKTERELQIRTNGKPSIVHFGPLDEINRYKSLELGWFGIDEADETTLDHWLVLCGRLRLKNMPLRGMLATNPTSPQHWIHDTFVKNPRPGYELFRSKTMDNVKNLPPGYIERMRQTYPDDWQKRFLDGEFGHMLAGDPCFPDFCAKHQRVCEPMQGLDMIRGWDFGLRHPCCVFAQFDDEGRFKILRTIKGENEDIYKFCDRVKKFSALHYNTFNFKDYVDPSGKNAKDSGKSSVQVLKEKGIQGRYRMSSPGERAIELRRMMRDYPAGEPAFQIDPANQYLIEGLNGGYMLDDEGEPKKDGYFEHGMDALGYIIANTCMTESKVTKSKIIVMEPKWRFGNRHA